jgi:hypothetical protein
LKEPWGRCRCDTNSRKADPNGGRETFAEGHHRTPRLPHESKRPVGVSPTGPDRRDREESRNPAAAAAYNFAMHPAFRMADTLMKEGFRTTAAARSILEAIEGRHLFCCCLVAEPVRPARVLMV